MSNYCSNCNQYGYQHKIYDIDCNSRCSSECDQYKEKADELYIKAKCIKEEAKRMICEYKTLEEEARELERRSKELYARAKGVQGNACKLETESNSLLELADFYSHKAYECYKNTSSICKDVHNCYEDEKCKTSCGSKGIVTKTSCRCTTLNHESCCD